MNTEHPLYAFSQEAVMQDYASSGAFRDDRDSGRLHMFFSPYRVPLGLTVEQIRICLNISRLKEERHKAEEQLKLSRVPEELRYLDPDLYEQKILEARINAAQPRRMPRELICSGFMEEEAFRKGICTLLASL